ncbi:MAG: DUF6443 domain-containing protein, partial [Prevotellaceae bacterium]|nr:DUF6443 domain-containing protein [Prevotellaceae bacterium]
MKARILSLVLFALCILPCSLFGQYTLPESLSAGSANYATTISANYATFTLNRLTSITSLYIISNGTISISPNVGTTGDMGASAGDIRYALAATNIPHGTYIITVNKTAGTGGIYIHVSCDGESFPPVAPGSANSSYPAAIGPGSSGRNYIVTRTYTSEDGSTWQDAVGYYDGLGRPEQTVRVKAGGGTGQKDLVSLTLYDARGREEKSYLPAALGSSNNGAYVNPSSLKTQAQTSNGSDSKPYSLNVYEASPLNRVVTQYGPGNAW